jgi:hypothetical protein
MVSDFLLSSVRLIDLSKVSVSYDIGQQKLAIIEYIAAIKKEVTIL